MPEFKIGEVVKAFNSKNWFKTGDIGNNEKFYQEAEIIDLRYAKDSLGQTHFVADIKWKHNSEISRGHFVGGLKRC